jgi:hypothetical protein
MRKYSGCEKVDLEILMDLHVFNLPEYGKRALSVCMYVCISASLAPERLDEFYSFIHFRYLRVYPLCHRLVNTNMGPRNTKKYDFLENYCNSFN